MLKFGGILVELDINKEGIRKTKRSLSSGPKMKW